MGKISVASEKLKRGGKFSLITLLVMSFAVLIPIAPAQAATSTMNYEARLKYGVTSREVHSSKKGSLKVSASVYSCDKRVGSTSSMKATIRLEHMSFVWRNKGTFTVSCGSSGSKTFKDMPKGSYRIYISKVDDGGYVTVSGKITYP